MRKSFLTAIGLVGILVSTGCSHPTKMPCPAVAVWSKEDQAAYAKELETSGPMEQRAALELFDLRTQARVCEKVYNNYHL